MSKLVTDLVFDGSTSKESEAVAMGGHNGVMFELWLKSLSGTLTGTGVTVQLEGSNDKLNWTPLGAEIATTVVSAPHYQNNDSTAVIAYGFVRLVFSLAGSGSPKALVDAALRTYTTSA